MHNVKLQVQGPFKIKHLFEDNFVSELEFAMQQLERHELTIKLCKYTLKKLNCSSFMGRITCRANDKLQVCS